LWAWLWQLLAAGAPLLLTFGLACLPWQLEGFCPTRTSKTSETSPLPWVLQLRAARSYRAQQQFLWHGCELTNDIHFNQVFNEALAGATYQKIIVRADGRICTRVTIPVSWYLSNEHTCAIVEFKKHYPLQVLHDNSALQPINVWWERLRGACAAFPVLHGDIMLAREHENLGWDVHALAKHVARFWK